MNAAAVATNATVQDPSYVPRPSGLGRTTSLPEPTYTSLFGVLLQATSPHAPTLSRATDYLADLEPFPNFWSLLLAIAFERRRLPIDPATLSLERGALGQEQVRGRGQEQVQSSSGIVPDQEIDARCSAIRALAIIRFKNGVDKYWRSRIVNRVTITIPKEKKEEIRNTLLRGCLDEPHRVVALQASVAVARIARLDFPHAWPTLFEDVQRAMVNAHASLSSASPSLQNCENDGGGSSSSSSSGTSGSVDRNRLILLRGSDVCSRTLKELGSVRILAGKVRMTELSRMLLPTLAPMLHQYFAETISPALSDVQRWATMPLLADRIRTCHLLLKAVTHLAVADAGTITKNTLAAGGLAPNLAQDFFRTTPGMLENLRDARLAFIQLVGSQGQSIDVQAFAGPILTNLQKYLVGFGKFYIALLQRDKSKAATWQGWEDVVWWYWVQARECTPLRMGEKDDTADGIDEDGELLKSHPRRFTVQALTLLRKSLEEWKRDLMLPGPFAQESFVQDATDTLMGRLMLFSRDDLQAWEADAEDWAVNEEAETFDIDVRPAAERTLMVLAATTKPAKAVGEYIWSKFEASLHASTSTSDLEALLRRDAMYAALGRCRDHLPEEAPLSLVAGQRLVAEASLDFDVGSSWVVIRRRIAWLIWEWSDHIQPPQRPAIYGLLVSLLEDVPGKTDAAVRLAAARSLSALADALEFDPEAFQPFVELALTRLAKLAAASDLHEMDSIKTCTNALAILLERLGPRVAPYVEQLASLVPPLWSSEDPDCKAKPSIIVFVGKLVRSVELIPQGRQGSGEQLHGLVEVIVRDSLQPANATLLGKDAFELWIRALRASPAMTEPLFRLLSLLPEYMNQPEFCPEACRVVQESTLMAPNEVLAHHGIPIFSAFTAIIADPMSPLILHPLSTLDIVIQALAAAPGSGHDVWPQLMDQTGLLAALVGSLLGVQESAVVSAYFVSLLARLAFVSSGDLFMQLLHAASARLAAGIAPRDVGAKIIKPMLLAWCQRFENMSSSRRRRSTCMGLAAVLGAAEPARESEVYETLPEMVSVWVEVLSELTSNDLANSSSSSAGGGSVSTSAPNAPPPSPLSHRSASGDYYQARGRSPSPALSLGLDDDGDWLEDNSPGKARINHLADVDPVFGTRLQELLSNTLNRAQAKDPQRFGAVMATIDPLLIEMLQKDLAK